MKTARPAAANPYVVEWRLHPNHHRPYQVTSDQTWTVFERLPTLEDAQSVLRHQQNLEGPQNKALFEWRVKPCAPTEKSKCFAMDTLTIRVERVLADRTLQIEEKADLKLFYDTRARAKDALIERINYLRRQLDLAETHAKALDPHKNKAP